MSSQPKTVKDVSRQTVKDVLGLDTIFRDMWGSFDRQSTVRDFETAEP